LLRFVVLTKIRRIFAFMSGAAPDIRSTSWKDGAQDLVTRPGIHFNHSQRLSRRRLPRNYLSTVESPAF
jgi:hypothetical protein